VTAEDREVAEGVRALRASLKESQQQFSNRLGVSISTIARYELQNPPQGNMLKRLAELAIQAGREDLSIIFEKALLEASDPRSPIAEAIRSLRIDLGDTQQEFAHRTGLSVVSIARYETNALPKKAVLTRLIKIAEDAGRNDLQSIFQRASSAEPAEPEIDESIQFVLQQMGTTEGNDFLRRISPQRLKRIRKLLSREFQSEGELSAMCAAAWLLDHYSYSPERDTILVEEIRRVLDKRTLPLTQAELEMLGELGRRALRAKVLTLPLSQAIKKLREFLGRTIWNKCCGLCAKRGISFPSWILPSRLL
jgi:transcriptional regulator with XRE-family HTH domain